jgi:hypothetical protein
VLAAEGPVCRLSGYVFVYNPKSTTFVRKPEKRTTIVYVSESGCIVNVIETDVTLSSVVYKYEQGVGLIATDGKAFSLNINEFGAKS